MTLDPKYHIVRMNRYIMEHYFMDINCMFVCTDRVSANTIKQMLAQMIVRADYCRQVQIGEQDPNTFLPFTIEQVTHQDRGIYAMLDVIDERASVVMPWMRSHQANFCLIDDASDGKQQLSMIEDRLDERFGETMQQCHY